MYRILVADDQVDVAQLWSIMLGELGHETHLAYDGSAALETARRLRPDIVLLDLGMPGISGTEVARQLRQEFPREAMVLVAFTGHGTDEIRRQALAAGFDYVFVKPIGFETLETLLSQPNLRRSSTSNN